MGLFALDVRLKNTNTSELRTEARFEPKRPVRQPPNIRRLDAAARKGDVEAGLQLARRYLGGVGVRKSEAQAYFFLHQITERYHNIGPSDTRAAMVADAMRTLAKLYRKGIAEARIDANPANAIELLRYAGSGLGDVSSQYDLGMMMLTGEGVPANPRMAFQWFLNASLKGHIAAQAKVGEMFWKGEGVGRSAGEGLGLLAVARYRSTGDDRRRIEEVFDGAARQATAAELLEANAFIAQEVTSLKGVLSDDLLIRQPLQSEATLREQRRKYWMFSRRQAVMLNAGLTTAPDLPRELGRSQSQYASNSSGSAR
jgi:TPR repeat protein